MIRKLLVQDRASKEYVHSGAKRAGGQEAKVPSKDVSAIY